MRVLNNKGQSLVLFVLLLPILLFVGVLVIDCGKVMVCKRELDVVSEMVSRYGIVNINSDNIENKVISLYDLNIEDGDVLVSVRDNYIKIESSMYVEGVFSNIIDIKGFKINSCYIGEFDGDKVIVTKC